MMKIGISYVALMFAENGTRARQTGGKYEAASEMHTSYFVIYQIKKAKIALVLNTSNRTMKYYFKNKTA